jgi:S-adenosylmethionine/arginine decarboxylase-like enzyme
MMDQEMLEKMPGQNTHPAMMIDSLRDLVSEAYATITVSTCGISNTVMVIEYLMAKAPEHPAMQNMTDTLDHSVLAIVLNRSTESMTSVAKRFNITKQAVSKKALNMADRLGMRFRAGKSESARKSYEARARRHHDKRRRETAKYNTGALMKGMKGIK